MKDLKSSRYLFISRTLRGGGAERFVSTFSSHLAECGYDIHVLVYEEYCDDYYLSEKVKKHVLPYEPLSIKGKVLRIRDMKQKLKSISPDYIIPFVDTVVICSYIANLFARKKFIYTVRVSPWHERLNKTRFSNGMRKLIAYTADAIMLQTKEQGEFYPNKYVRREYIVPNPIPNKYETLKKEIYAKEIVSIIMVGRLEKQKNYDLFIRALYNVRNKERLRVRIYGEGSEKEKLNDLIRNLKLEEQCILCGRVDNVDEVLIESDLYVLSSDFEGMPNALMEAMAIGLPCIASDCRTGPKDLISHHKTGLLFKSH